jgi:hypothetical protein
MSVDRPPSTELLQFLDVYAPELVALALELRERILDEAPEANEIVYDGAYTVALHYSATTRYQDAFCYIALFTNHINLGFNRGADLPDPKKQLEGTGTQMRHLKIKDSADLARPAIRTFLRAALKQAAFKQAVKASTEELGQTILKRFGGPKKRPGR